MKTHIILAVGIFSFINSFSQTEKLTSQYPAPILGQVGELFTAGLNFKITGCDTIYSLRFQNQFNEESVDIREISFNSRNCTADSLFKIFTEVLGNKTEKYYQIQLGDDLVRVAPYSITGVPLINVLTRGAVFTMNRMQIKQLFGKLD